MDLPAWPWLVFNCARFCIFLTITLLGCALTLEMDGSRFYTLHEWYQPFTPHCRVIIFSADLVDIIDESVSLGSTGQGAIWSGGTVTAQAKIDALSGGGEYEIEHASSAEQCRIYETSARLLVLNAETGQEIELPGNCEKAEAEHWNRSGDLLSTPAIHACLGCWSFIRSLGLFVSYKLSHGWNQRGSQCGQICVKVLKFMVFSWCMSILVAPISNMATPEACPQVLVSFYSYKAQLTLSILTMPLFFFLLGMAKKFMENEAIHDAEGNMFQAMVRFCKHCWYVLVKRPYEEWQEAAGSEVKKRFKPFAIMVVGLFFILSVPLTLVFTVYYKVAEILQIGFSVVLGFRIDFELHHWDVGFALRLNVLRVLCFLLTLLDFADIFASSFGPVLDKVPGLPGTVIGKKSGNTESRV